jgi:glycosyltransferase involved in cell wall biosynthesis
VHLSIIIPCYNEQETVPRLVAALDTSVAELGRQGHPTEVVIVDDGSRDRSFELLRNAAADRPYLKLIRFRRNFGQTAAMAAGFRHATGEVLIPMDADLQNDPSDIPRLLDKLAEGYDVVSGWRKNRQDTFVTRTLPSRIANWLIGRVGGVRIHDYGCTLKAYRREVIDPINLYGEMHRFIPIYASWAGARVTEIPVTHHPRLEGTSKYGLSRTLKVVLDLFTVKFLGDYSTKPIYLFGGLGMILCGLGTASGVWVAIQKIIWGVWAHRNPFLLFAVFLFVIGFLLVMMGLLAELIIRTYHEAQGKPIYLVRETVNVAPREGSGAWTIPVAAAGQARSSAGGPSPPGAPPVPPDSPDPGNPPPRLAG